MRPISFQWTNSIYYEDTNYLKLQFPGLSLRILARYDAIITEKLTPLHVFPNTVCKFKKLSLRFLEDGLVKELLRETYKGGMILAFT